jgi:putative hemolysin
VTRGGPFRLPLPFEDPVRRSLLAPAGALVEWALGLSTLDAMYRRLPRDEGRPFWDRALDALEIRVDAAIDDDPPVPREGALVVIANHPFGGVDGLVLASLLHRWRADVKIVANAFLGTIPDLRGLFVFVNPFGTSSATASNGAGLRAALRWLRDGHVLAMFPAGEVSHVRSAAGLTVDPRWTPGLARIVRHAGAPVLPVHFEGDNSRLFRIAGRLHPRMRTVMLPRELLRRRGRPIAVRAGRAIPFSRLAAFESDEEMTAYLRVRTYALGGRATRGGSEAPRWPRGRAAAAVEAPESTEALATEVERLPAAQRLGGAGDLEVLVGRADQVPGIVREIGRLRELTFRAAGEGTGLSTDLDRFDRHYWHLFLWDRVNRQIVGAYRIGATDEIVPRAGVAGLYTSTLFRYDRRLLDQIDPALELGRAFVRAEHQREYSPLMLLWKGIGTFVSRRPRYRMLFGPVSISNEYRSLSRQLLASFLQATCPRSDLAALIAPRHPAPFLRDSRTLEALPATVVRSLAEVGTLLAEIEADRKGVPVLLRQYLKLNARLLGFNLDPAFGGVLDGLMLVDLCEVDRDILVRYMGRTGAEVFLKQHER